MTIEKPLPSNTDTNEIEPIKPQFSGEWVKLGDVASYINGYAFKPTDYASEGKPIIRIQDLTGNAYQTNRFAGILDDKYRVGWGDVLISWSASLGVYVWSAEEAWLNQHIFKVQFNKLPVNKRFFIHQTRYVIAESASLAHGATMRHLTKKVFDNLPFFYPSEHDQDEIACHLDEIQLQIDSASEMLVRLDALVKSRFNELFGKVVENNLHFPVIKLDDVCTSIVRGPFGSALKKEFFVPKRPGAYKVYEQKHAIQKQADIGIYYIDGDRYESLNRFECHPGDILMSCSGTIGELYQLPPNCEPGVINQALCKFSLSDAIHVEYFLGCMNQIVDRLGAKGSGIKNVSSVKFIKAIEIPLPPITLQRDFATFSVQVDKLRFKTQQQIEKLEILKESLMQEYFG